MSDAHYSSEQGQGKDRRDKQEPWHNVCCGTESILGFQSSIAPVSNAIDAAIDR